jgi:Cytochrome c oxidase assembly factor 3
MHPESKAKYGSNVWQRKRMPISFTLLALAGFTAGVYYYTITAVKQDDLSDFDEQGNLKNPSS